MDQHLSLNDLGQVIEELHDASLKWYKIGLQLKLSPTCLDKIKEEESDSSDKLLEMSKAWLKKIEPKPTWLALVQALRTRSVGEEKEASRLEKKYCISLKMPSAATTRANEQQPDPMTPKQQPQVADTETALATSVQLQKSTEGAKTTTKRAPTSTDESKNAQTKEIQAAVQLITCKKCFDKSSLEVECSNAEKGCSWKGTLKELKHRRRLTCLKEEVACPYSEVGCEIRCLREKLDDHQNQSQRYHLDLTLATIKDEPKQNNIRCKKCPRWM